MLSGYSVISDSNMNFTNSTVITNKNSLLQTMKYRIVASLHVNVQSMSNHTSRFIDECEKYYIVNLGDVSTN